MTNADACTFSYRGDSSVLGVKPMVFAVLSSSPAYTWQYDDQHQRFKENRVIAAGTMAGTRTTWMLHPDNAGGLAFESEVNSPTSPSAANPSATSNRHYLEAGGQSIGVLVSSGALPTLTASQTAPTQLTSVTLVKVEYWHKDHLGSLAATTDHAAAVTARYTYDPFGKRRFASGSYDPFGALVIDWSPAVNAGGDRGFTGHEQLDDVGLVHMNGRIYDANIGRFVQPDPQITFPEDLRSFDRYTYVLNDPLGMTDPTGLEVKEENNNRNVTKIGSCEAHGRCEVTQGGSGLEARTSNSDSKGAPGQGGAGTQPQGKTDYGGASAVAGGGTAAKGDGGSGSGGDQNAAASAWLGGLEASKVKLGDAMGPVCQGGECARNLVSLVGYVFKPVALAEGAYSSYETGSALPLVAALVGAKLGGSGPTNVVAHEAYKDGLRAAMSKPAVSDANLSRLIDPLYRPNATVGSGSTAAAVRQELATGQPVGGAFHSKKATDSIRSLERWLANNPAARPGDRAAAENVIRDMSNALRGR